MLQNQKYPVHQQALAQMQLLFPFDLVSLFSSKTSLKDLLKSINSNLPVPMSFNHISVLQSMKSIADFQQYKIQRNMIEIDNFINFSQIDEFSLDLYEQRSTAIQFNKQLSVQTSGSSAMPDQTENLWFNFQQKNPLSEDLQKDFFSFLE